LAVIDMILHFI